MITLNMIRKSIRIFLKDISVQPANIAFIIHIFLHLIFAISEFCKSINNNTENNIKKNDINQNEKSDIKEKSKPISILIIRAI